MLPSEQKKKYEEFSQKLLAFETRLENRGIAVSSSRCLNQICIVRRDRKRTMAQQTKLYSAGRTNPGRIVTNAKPGQSPHNFGLAQDYVLFRAGKPVWSAKDPVFAVMANVADQCGLESGLRFANLGDAGHIQLKYWNA